MTLYLKYRPQSLSEIQGNGDLVEGLTAALAKKDHPKSYLLHGPTGCGKTTIGRIIAKEVCCKGADYREIDSADFRGIDSIREIRKQSQFMPLEGKCKVWLIDECFAKGTLVSMQDGSQKPIEQVKIGELVANLKGTGEVTNVFQNQVNLDRVVRVHFTDGRSVICSKEHEFLTARGWKKAQDLNKKDLTFLSKGNKIKHGINSLNTGEYHAKKSKLPLLWESFIQMADEILLQTMQQYCQCPACPDGNSNMSYLRYGVCRKMVFGQENLFKGLWKYISRKDENRAKKKPRMLREDINHAKNLKNQESGSRRADFSDAFRTNETKQSNAKQEKHPKNESYQTDEWDASYLERGKRRKWEINRASSFIINRIRMAGRSGDSNRALPWRRWIPFKLQSGYREHGTQISHRSRWAGTLLERRALIGQEERGQIERAGVDHVEIYQRGNNDRSFQSVIGDKEKSKGFVTFYDLEVSKHPSYFANGCLVHNCHQLSRDAQNALLKALEDTPRHVYYILCTTDPQKLLPTIRGRCSQFKVEQLKQGEMRKLLMRVVKAENEKLLKPVYEAIIESAQGHPRNALQILDQVLTTEPDARMRVAEKAQEESVQAIELCRAIISGAGWTKVSNILTELKDQDAEGIRRLVLGYCSAVLLKGENSQAGLIMEEFREPMYDIGFPGVVLACYSVVCGAEEE